MWTTNKINKVPEQRTIQGTWRLDLIDIEPSKYIKIEDVYYEDISSVYDFKKAIIKYIKDNLNTDNYLDGFYITIDELLFMEHDFIKFSDIYNDAQIRIFRNKKLSD